MWVLAPLECRCDDDLSNMAVCEHSVLSPRLDSTLTPALHLQLL